MFLAILRLQLLALWAVTKLAQALIPGSQPLLTVVAWDGEVASAASLALGNEAKAYPGEEFPEQNLAFLIPLHFPSSPGTQGLR